MKQKISEYIRDNYAGKGPDPRTIVARIKSGALAGELEGGLWYVYLSSPSTGNERADKILRELGCF